MFLFCHLTLSPCICLSSPHSTRLFSVLFPKHLHTFSINGHSESLVRLCPLRVARGQFRSDLWAEQGQREMENLEENACASDKEREAAEKKKKNVVGLGCLFITMKTMGFGIEVSLGGDGYSDGAVAKGKQVVLAIRWWRELKEGAEGRTWDHLPFCLVKTQQAPITMSAPKTTVLPGDGQGFKKCIGPARRGEEKLFKQKESKVHDKSCSCMDPSHQVTGTITNGRKHTKTQWTRILNGRATDRQLTGTERYPAWMPRCCRCRPASPPPDS